MHFRLYVCLPMEEATNSLRARQGVSRYLKREGFDLETRFSGDCDYFSIGGRWSGSLTLLRLSQQHPRKFRRYWKENMKNLVASPDLFKEHFPAFQGEIPIGREQQDWGNRDDAQLMDEVLFEALHKNFDENILFCWELGEPNVISTRYEFPKHSASMIGNYWIVVVDYHA